MGCAELFGRKGVIFGCLLCESGVAGDGWTPLMAAAVAERQDVAALLLESCGLSGERERFVRRAEPVRADGAARVGARGSRWFVQSLLEHGASCDVQDGRGQRASGIAQKHGHVELVELLRHLEKALLPAPPRRRGGEGRPRRQRRAQTWYSSRKLARKECKWRRKG